MTFVTPPLPDVDRLRGALWAWVVVMHSELMHTYIGWAVQDDERIIQQINLMDLIEDLLAR